jgi:hypothetical protein
MRTDNSTADGIMNKTVKQKQSKSMDMRFYWLQDRVEQGQFKKIWAPGKINLADYHSKVQPTLVHRTLRPIYLYEKGKSPTTLQLATGTNTNAIRYLTKTGSCSRASFSCPQQSPSLRSIAAQMK